MAAKSLKSQYPYLHNWLQDGQVEFGYAEYDHVFIRVTDAGGTVWESESHVKYRDLEEAMAAANQAIADWCDENGIDLIDVW